MRLKLVNFRCHANAEFEFPDSGLVLLSGYSGSGKSTVLKAILYALFGNKAVRKPYTFGSTTCTVTLDWIGLHIQRTNRPNRLVVNDLEDAAAQSIIDEKLGAGYEEFLISSYIPQKNNSSILSMSQLEQLAMIKTLAFHGDLSEQYKERLKEMVKDSSTDLTEKRAELEVTQRQLDHFTERLKPVSFPLGKCKDKEAAITEYRQRLGSYNEQISAILEEKSNLADELQKHKHNLVELETLQEKYKTATKQLSKLVEKEKELSSKLVDKPAEIKTELAQADLAIKFLELAGKKDALAKQYTQIQADEKHEKEERHRKLLQLLEETPDPTEELDTLTTELNLWKRHQKATSELLKLQKNISEKLDQKELVSYCEGNIAQLEEERDELLEQQKQLTLNIERLALERTIVHCPECNKPLRWKEETLVSVNDHQPVEKRDYKTELIVVKKAIDKITANIKENERTLTMAKAITFPDLDPKPEEHYDHTTKRVEELVSVKAQKTQWRQELTRVEKELSAESPALKRIKGQLHTKTEELKKVQSALNEIPTDKDSRVYSSKAHALQDRLNKHAEYTKELEKIKREVRELERDIDKIEKKQEMLEKELAENNPDLLQEAVNTLEKDLSQIKKEQEADEKLREKVEAYLVYRDGKKELEHWEEEYAQIERKHKRAEKKHTANLILKEKYTQAEILALETTIDSINEHTRYYLDTFFTEHQLSAIIEAAQKGKVKNLKINTTLSYKGNEYDSISQLSGGEFDRCTLASICGINSMLASPVLILDESLASLDTDTNTEIIRFLSELGQDKLVLVCSHEAVRGIFDTVVDL